MKRIPLLFSAPRSDASNRRSSVHLHDAMNLRRAMQYLTVATIPCIVFGIINAGYQANVAMDTQQISHSPGWRGPLLSVFKVNYAPSNAWDNFCHGMLFFLPLLLITYVTTIFWEQIFARARQRVAVEGALATAILFTLTLPPTLPLWQAVLGCSFGIVVGREIFGGAGMNVVHPILVGRAFLYFAYPEQITAETVWVGIDGISGATMLSVAKTIDLQAMYASDVTWMMAFIGRMSGALGETSALACLLGGSLLLAKGLIPWRIVAGILLGLIITCFMFNLTGSDTNSLFTLPWYWHLVLGGFAFGLFFIAPDPVTSPTTNAGRWLYGLLIGALVVVIRVTNPAIPEGVMFAILLANVFAPSMDYLVVRANISRRARARKSRTKTLAGEP